MNSKRAGSLIEAVERVLNGQGALESILVLEKGKPNLLLEGSKWFQGDAKKRIRVDTPHVKGQQKHAHLIGKSGHQYGVVNLDGSSSHGTKITLTRGDAKALQDLGFSIPANRVVEWVETSDPSLQLLFG